MGATSRSRPRAGAHQNLSPAATRNRKQPFPADTTSQHLLYVVSATHAQRKTWLVCTSKHWTGTFVYFSNGHLILVGNKSKSGARRVTSLWFPRTAQRASRISNTNIPPSKHPPNESHPPFCLYQAFHRQVSLSSRCLSIVLVRLVTPSPPPHARTRSTPLLVASAPPRVFPLCISRC